MLNGYCVRFISQNNFRIWQQKRIWSGQSHTGSCLIDNFLVKNKEEFNISAKYFRDFLKIV